MILPRFIPFAKLLDEHQRDHIPYSDNQPSTIRLYETEPHSPRKGPEPKVSAYGTTPKWPLRSQRASRIPSAVPSVAVHPLQLEDIDIAEPENYFSCTPARPLSINHNDPFRGCQPIARVIDKIHNQSESVLLPFCRFRFDMSCELFLIWALCATFHLLILHSVLFAKLGLTAYQVNLNQVGMSNATQKTSCKKSLQINIIHCKSLIKLHFLAIYNYRCFSQCLTGLNHLHKLA